MVLSTDQLFDVRTLLLVGVAIAVAVVAAVLALAYGRPPRRRSHLEIAPQRRRLAVVESLDIDPHRRVVILRRDAVEHLVLIGGPSDLVIETDIMRPAEPRLAGLPVTRGARTEPEESPREHLAPGFDEEHELDRRTVPPRPERIPDFPESYGAVRRSPSVDVPPIRSPYRAPPPPSPADVRAASPVPPRRSPPPPQPAQSRSTFYRGAIIPRATVPPTAEDIAREDAASAARRSLATPVLRSTPPSPAAAEPDIEETEDHTTVAQSQSDDAQVATRVEPVAAEISPRQETEPETDTSPTKVDETADVPREPEISAEASNGRAPIDRLEAEIARLLGRAQAG